MKVVGRFLIFLFQHNIPIKRASHIWNKGMNLDKMELN